MSGLFDCFVYSNIWFIFKLDQLLSRRYFDFLVVFRKFYVIYSNEVPKIIRILPRETEDGTTWIGKGQGYCSLVFRSCLNFSSCQDFDEARADVEHDGPGKMHQEDDSQRSSQFQTQCPEMNDCTRKSLAPSSQFWLIL